MYNHYFKRLTYFAFKNTGFSTFNSISYKLSPSHTLPTPKQLMTMIRYLPYRYQEAMEVLALYSDPTGI